MKNVYDNADFFEKYQTTRSQEINANNLIENPIIKSMLPNLKNKTILDLGCGDGNLDAYFLLQGAKMVYGIDISQNMINSAKQNYPDPKLKFEVMKMEDISQIKEKFDIVYSSLAFHYVEDFNKLIQNIKKLLKKNGLLIFSQESPINTASIYEKEEQEKKIEIYNKLYYLFSDYCNESVRNNFWNGVRVTKYHRTYATIVNTLINNKFDIIEIKDSYASKEAIKLCEKYKHQKDKPFFVFVKAKKHR